MTYINPTPVLLKDGRKPVILLLSGKAAKNCDTYNLRVKSLDGDFLQCAYSSFNLLPCFDATLKTSAGRWVRRRGAPQAVNTLLGTS